eukprot:COSAG05_NODE_256_length_12752_cov_5.614795_3_plen_134_part_00
MHDGRFDPMQRLHGARTHTVLVQYAVLLRMAFPLLTEKAFPLLTEMKVDRSLVSQPASQQPPRVAVPRWRRRRAGPATPSDGWGHPAMPESRPQVRAVPFLGAGSSAYELVLRGTDVRGVMQMGLAAWAETAI